jgi:hypothetical protein
MARKFLISIDLTQNQILNAALQNLGSAPGSPVAGQVYFDTTANRPLCWNAVAGAWQWRGTDSDLLNAQAGTFYLARANHTGTQLAATISNLQSTVITYTLDTFAAPVAAVSLGGQKITNLAAPVAGTDAANKNYVDSTAQGLQAKPTAQVATITTLPACTYSNGTAGVGATLTATSNGVLTIDGYAVALADLVLVKNQASSFQNGLYVVSTLGTGSVPYVLTRHADMDQATEFGGAFIPVENNGTVTANTLWLCNVANSIIVGTTAVTLTQLNAATSLTQGNGITISGGVVTFLPDPAAGKGLLVTGSGAAVDTSVVVRKFAAAFGDGATLSYTITHNLGTQDVTVRVYSATTPWAEVECDINHATTNTITLIFAVAPTTNQYRVVVHG